MSTERALKSGPVTLRDLEAPQLPGPDWIRVKPLLAGICGSDLATVFFESSRYFLPLVSFPFVPGHEVVVETEAMPGHYVIEPALTCKVRGLELCANCRSGNTQLCQNVNLGDIDVGIQTGYCASTGGGWATELVAHRETLHKVPDGMALSDAVMIEPLACAIHTALRPESAGTNLAIIGAGTVGLTILAAAVALKRFDSCTIAAKYPIQKEMAVQFGADAVVSPGELLSRARRLGPYNRIGHFLGGGFDVVIDAVGSKSSLSLALEAVKPQGEIVLAGMPARLDIDLAPLWHKEVALKGSYAYGTEYLEQEVAASLGVPQSVRTFDLAVALAQSLSIGRLVTHRYHLTDYVTAIAKARGAGKQDAIKVVFDMTKKRKKNDG
jgi:threonine dehydrogenase-like Zn-dependent dehydrogenase